MTTSIPIRAPSEHPVRACIFGAAPATGNLGVTALCHSLVAGIVRRAPDAHVTVFDDRPGVRPATLVVDDRHFEFELSCAIPTRRLYRRDSLWRLRTEGRLGISGAPALDAVSRADLVLDVTGGDSFTDLYGPRRFARGLDEKRLVLDQGRPLILAPQTIGPFATVRARRAATRVLRAASMVWCRDDDSLAALRKLLGDAWDPARHRLGVDVAFALPARAPQTSRSAPVQAWLDDAVARPIIGLNVSGLLLNDEPHARRRFGLRADYRAVVTALLDRLLSATGYRVLLVPHVITHPGHHEHDPDAAAATLASVAPGHRSRVAVLPDLADPAEAKWAISRCAWLCATRMHAAIAALSSSVPAAALAYSGKTSGVFGQCGLGDHVADLRRASTRAVLDRMWSAFQDRYRTRADLVRRMPPLLARAESQLDTMIGRARRERDMTKDRRTAA